MYLEISARQTGKTTRLIKQAISDAINGHEVIIVTNNVSNKKILYNKIIEEINQKPDIEDFQKSALLTHIRLLGVYEVKNFLESECEFAEYDYLWFYDEFDLIREDYQIIFSEDGYYTTTPKRNRTVEDIISHKIGKKPDPLLKLIEMNNGKYVQHSSLLTMECNNLFNLSSMSSQDFNLEYGVQLFKW